MQFFFISSLSLIHSLPLPPLPHGIGSNYDLKMCKWMMLDSNLLINISYGFLIVRNLVFLLYNYIYTTYIAYSLSLQFTIYQMWLHFALPFSHPKKTKELVFSNFFDCFLSLHPLFLSKHFPWALIQVFFFIFSLFFA